DVGGSRRGEEERRQALEYGKDFSQRGRRQRDARENEA
ncbi:hypothetical protein A2U01_0110101, partial [Trifolium medium]|nr:hypothetical protein [Trifolium medium]